MTNEERYNALLKFVKKYGDYSKDLNDYDLNICYSASLFYDPEAKETNECFNDEFHSEELSVYDKSLHGVGDYYLEVTPENIDEALEFLKKRLGRAKELLELLEEIDD